MAVVNRVGNVSCRNAIYRGSGGIKRFPVGDDKVSWKVNWSEYAPVDYTSSSVEKGPIWADPDFKKGPPPAHPPRYNELDGKVNRKSHTGTYEVIEGVPRNPVGRTGMIGRGLLGKWGPNHAADPVVTRWKRTGDGERVMLHDKPCLEFVAIKRGDTGEWALPGGMVEAGDTVSITLKKEFGEEAMNSIEATEERKKQIEEGINKLFHKGEEVFSGYVDDPRNTDNAWMETVAHNFHDETGDATSLIKLEAGDDAAAVIWMGISDQLELYSSHRDIILEVVRRKQAAWKT